MRQRKHRDHADLKSSCGSFRRIKKLPRLARTELVSFKINHSMWHVTTRYRQYRRALHVYREMLARCFGFGRREMDSGLAPLFSPRHRKAESFVCILSIPALGSS